MSLEKVKEYFKAYGIEDRITELSESSATVELAAHALHTEPCRIAKTLSFMLGDSPILVVTAGNVKIDNAKYRHTFGAKAKMLTADCPDQLCVHQQAISKESQTIVCLPNKVVAEVTGNTKKDYDAVVQ